MHLEDQVRPGAQRPGKSRLSKLGDPPWLPGQELTGGHVGRWRNVHAVEPCRVRSLRKPPAMPGFVNVNEDMMKHARVVRVEFDPLNKARSVQGNWENQVAIDVLALGRHVKGLRRSDYEVRRSKPPTLGEFRGLGQVLGITFRRAGSVP